MIQLIIASIARIGCKVWLRDIECDRARKKGSTSFELFTWRPMTNNQLSGVSSNKRSREKVFEYLTSTRLNLSC